MTFALVRKLLFPESKHSPISLHIQQHADSICLTSYKNPSVQQCIRDAKYHHHIHAARELGMLLESFLTNRPAEQVHIIPIPQSYHRWRERGYHHIERIVKATNYVDCLRSDILSRSRHTKRQTHVDRATRITQQAGTFSHNKEQVRTLRGTVILLDDVLTTGATMQAARDTLSPHLPAETKLICVALASSK